MRNLMLLGLSLSLLLALAPAPALANATIDHVTIQRGSLAPGEYREFDLVFVEGPLYTDWLFFLVGSVQGGELELELIAPGDRPAASFRWSPQPAGSAPQNASLALPATGYYRLGLRASGSQRVEYELYYDLSCFCVQKELFLPAGLLVFSVAAQSGEIIEQQFSLPRGSEWSYLVGRRVAARGQWPQDYQVIEAELQPVTTGSRQTLRFQADANAVYYIVLTSQAATGTVSRVVNVTPGSLPPGALSSLLLAVPIGVALLIGGLVGIQVWRRRRASR